MSKKDDGLHLADMLEAIGKIEEFIADYSLDKFTEDRKTYSAVLRELSVLGEAAARTSEKFREHHPEVPWHEVIGMRNRLMHDYDEVDDPIVWNTCTEDIPKLKKALMEIA